MSGLSKMKGKKIVEMHWKKGSFLGPWLDASSRVNLAETPLANAALAEFMTSK